MSNQLLDVQPRDLKFTFELKKQSTCSVRVVNKTDFPVAFKVKTTSPKKYCVRPNVGIVKPKAACDFVVTMQGQNTAPTDLICKDKFLVQSTIVPVGTIDQDITSSMFVKDDIKRVEDIKLKVTLVSPSHSTTELPPNKEAHHQMPAHEATPLEEHVFNGIDVISQQKEKNLEGINLLNSHIIEEIMPPSQTNTGVVDIIEDVTIQNHKNNDDINVSQKEIIEDTGLQKHRASEEMNARKNDFVGDSRMQNDNTITEIAPLTKHESEEKGFQKHSISEDINGWQHDITGDVSVQKESTIARIIPATKHNTENVIPNSQVASIASESVVKNSVVGEVAGDFGMKKDVTVGQVAGDFGMKKDVTDLELVKDIETMKSKLNGLESKLREAEMTISKLTEERRLSSEERDSLRKEVVAIRSRTVVKKTVQAGFPFLYIIVVAFISMVLGYRFHC